MNANMIINMVIRQVMRRVVGRGINAGMDVVGKKMSKGKADEPPMPGAAQSQKQMRQSMKVTRRLGKF